MPKTHWCWKSWTLVGKAGPWRLQTIAGECPGAAEFLLKTGGLYQAELYFLLTQMQNHEAEWVCLLHWITYIRTPFQCVLEYQQLLIHSSGTQMTLPMADWCLCVLLMNLQSTVVLDSLWPFEFILLIYKYDLNHQIFTQILIVDIENPF